MSNKELAGAYLSELQIVRDGNVLPDSESWLRNAAAELWKRGYSVQYLVKTGELRKRPK